MRSYDVIKAAGDVAKACGDARSAAIFLLVASETEPDLTLRIARVERLAHKILDVTCALRKAQRREAEAQHLSQTEGGI